MWIFGQVWFACLVGFAAGVLLDWVVRVRPLANRVTDLESRLEADSRAARAEAIASGTASGTAAGAGSGSAFERGRYDGPGRFDSTGFDGDHGRGLLTPANGGSLAADLLDHPQQTPQPHDEEPAPSTSGVEDFPGVARLSGIWADEDDAERTRISAAEPSTWEPDPETRTWEPESRESAMEAATPTSITPLVPPSDADQRYLEFLRAGGVPTEPGDPTDETPGEVTSVLPYSDADGYQAYEAYTEYGDNGYRTNGHGDYAAESYQQGDYQHDGYQIVDYQHEDLSEPGVAGGPLPHRQPADLGHRYAPFEIPFGQFDNSDVQPHAGELTPIGDGGFHPFQKPGDDAEPTDESSWFDLTDPGSPPPAPPTPSEAASTTSRMLPIGDPGVEHPDLLGTSVFGSVDDTSYGDEGQARSLFEPVIAPDAVHDEWDQPDAPRFDAPPFDPTAGQGTTPRPIRVRTGMDAPPPATQAKASAANGTPPMPTPPPPAPGEAPGGPYGPFGPGSALPLPDGSPPSGEFRVKARTSSMVFHTESSPFYERLEPQVWFRDAKDAQRAGFTSWERPRSW